MISLLSSPKIKKSGNYLAILIIWTFLVSATLSVTTLKTAVKSIKKAKLAIEKEEREHYDKINNRFLKVQAVSLEINDRLKSNDVVADSLARKKYFLMKTRDLEQAIMEAEIELEKLGQDKSIRWYKELFRKEHFLPTRQLQAIAASKRYLRISENIIISENESSDNPALLDKNYELLVEKINAAK